MSDAPTFASLLTQWSDGGPTARAAVYAHLRAHPAEAAAVEASLRGELASDAPQKRVLAAEALVAVYGDHACAADALRAVLRTSDEAAALDAVGVLWQLDAPAAAPVLADLARLAPGAFRVQTGAFYRWAGSAAVRGADHLGHWIDVLAHAPPHAESALLMGLADAAPHCPYDLEPAVPALRARLTLPHCGYAAGGALWRVTWRVNRDWLESVYAHSPQFDNNRPLLVFVIRVLTEHLGRRPDLAADVLQLLVRLGNDDADEFKAVLKRLAGLGGRGWAVLLPALGDAGVPAHTRAHVFAEAAARPAVHALAHHHAHGVLLARAADRGAAPPDLLSAAAGVLRAIGPPAGSALPDLLDLMVKQPEVTRHLAPAVPALAPGWPLHAGALARALDRMRRNYTFVPDAFDALAAVLATLNPDAAPALVDETSFDPRTVDLLAQHPAWHAADPATRARHARQVANRLAAPRAEVRARAADLLRHYTDQLPAIWPALVAALACPDEKVVLLALGYFRYLGPVADAVAPELAALFREPNPTYAARAVVALWRLGRMPLVTAELRAAVVSGDENSWGWAVLRGVADRVAQAHGLLTDLTAAFAAAPQEVAAKVQALLSPPEEVDEAAISAHVRPGQVPVVVWDGVYQRVQNDIEGGFLFLALMCAHGSFGFAAQKIWMIKHQRTIGGTGLAEAKGIVERAIDRLTTTATVADRQTSVREYFAHEQAAPKALTDLLEHRTSWYRWAGLELLDAWGAHDPALVADRVWDRSALVRARALRMWQG
jgi:hypothetical protein